MFRPTIMPRIMNPLGLMSTKFRPTIMPRIMNPLGQMSTKFTRRLHMSFKTMNKPLVEQEKQAYRLRMEDADKLRKEQVKLRNTSTTYYFASLAMVFLALAFAAVPLYRAICQRTGWSGIPITDSNQFTADKVIPVDTNKRIRISFTCQSSGILPWKFTPQQREVYVVPGETALAFYKAKNMSKDDIIGMATYSVAPEHTAGYFNKIQCFCFEEQRLAAGEEVDMPVFFFIDPEFAKDPAMRNIDDIVLHYTFFKARYAEGELEAVPTGELEAVPTDQVQLTPA
ncbi:cytochrome c oxidase assembly protein Cox11p, mitochondrial [[Candida] anglica]|uniref:Cytochrome c oxidase assembly protein Cox11p, mitochondrial n=1 Tax=[Candida] anglica TaxID=148631 RepID=A0ABP0ELY7_9ASCO